MATLSKDEITQLARGAGIPILASSWMAEIALAESGGRTDAVGHNSNGTTDTGLWQINSVHLKAHPQWTSSWLKDPRNNAEAAATLLKAAGGKPTPWSASEDKWKPKIEAGDPAAGLRNWLEDAAGTAGDVAGGVVGAAVNPLDVIADIGEQALEFLTFLTEPNTWKRVALISLGAGIVFAGVAVIARGTEVGQAVESVVKQGATKGVVK